MQEDSILVTHREVSCDGGKGPLGHPKVYLYIGKDDRVVCPYCSKVFKLANTTRLAQEEQLP